MVEEHNVLEEATKIAERIEEANRVQAEQIKKLEAIEVRRTLGGQSNISAPIVEVREEDKMKQELKNYWKGTALEKVFQ
jgi:hypothetical protein